MKVDISFILSFPISKKDHIVKDLKMFCVNTDDYTFNPDLITANCSIDFLIDDEEATAWFKKEYEFSRTFPGKTCIGSICLSIKCNEQTVQFEFWPPFSNGGQVCLDSDALKQHFILLLKKQKHQNYGYQLYLDDSRGYIAPLYLHRDYD